MDHINQFFESYQPKPIGNHKRYAVLLPLINVNNEWHILYEVRSQHISQPGEMSFPGGRVEAGESFRDAAIRETMEELNVAKDAINVIGEMDYLMNEQMQIHCFIGKLNVPVEEIQFNEEVEELITVPLDHFLANSPVYYEPEFQMKESTQFPYELIPNGINYRFRSPKRRIPFYQLEKRTLWGFTAQFTERFIELIRKID